MKLDISFEIQKWIDICIFTIFMNVQLLFYLNWMLTLGPVRMMRMQHHTYVNWMYGLLKWELIGVISYIPFFKTTESVTRKCLKMKHLFLNEWMSLCLSLTKIKITSKYNVQCKNFSRPHYVCFLRNSLEWGENGSCSTKKVIFIVFFLSSIMKTTAEVY